MRLVYELLCTSLDTGLYFNTTVSKGVSFFLEKSWATAANSPAGWTTSEYHHLQLNTLHLGCCPRDGNLCVTQYESNPHAQEPGNATFYGAVCTSWNQIIQSRTPDLARVSLSINRNGVLQKLLFLKGRTLYLQSRWKNMWVLRKNNNPKTNKQFYNVCGYTMNGKSIPVYNQQE